MMVVVYDKGKAIACIEGSPETISTSLMSYTGMNYVEFADDAGVFGLMTAPLWSSVRKKAKAV